MLSFLLVIPLIVASIYLSLIYESTGFALWGITATLFAVVSFIYLMIIKKKVSVVIDVPLRVADRDQVFGLQTEVRNNSRFPLGKLSIDLAYGECQMETKEKMTISMMDVPNGKHQENQKMSIGQSGYYEFIVDQIRIYGLLGLFFISKKVKSGARVLILPKLEVVPVRLGEGVTFFLGDALEYDEVVPGKDPSEIFGVREFYNGDKLQRIHWKLSARMDALMVKEDSRPKACAIVLFMPDGSRKDSKSLDYVASLSFTLMQEQCPHYVAWQSRSEGDVIRVCVEDEESFYYALTESMQDGALKESEDRVERYREKYKGEPYLHSVLADADGNLVIDGQQILKPEEYREELFLR